VIESGSSAITYNGACPFFFFFFFFSRVVEATSGSFLSTPGAVQVGESGRILSGKKANELIVKPVPCGLKLNTKVSVHLKVM